MPPTPTPILRQKAHRGTAPLDSATPNQFPRPPREHAADLRRHHPHKLNGHTVSESRTRAAPTSAAARGSLPACRCAPPCCHHSTAWPSRSRGSLPACRCATPCRRHSDGPRPAPPLTDALWSWMEWTVVASLLWAALVAAPWCATPLKNRSPSRMRSQVQRYVSLAVGILLMLCGGTPCESGRLRRSAPSLRGCTPATLCCTHEASC